MVGGSWRFVSRFRLKLRRIWFLAVIGDGFQGFSGEFPMSCAGFWGMTAENGEGEELGQLVLSPPPG
jgi:hypothetical protein